MAVARRVSLSADVKDALAREIPATAGTKTALRDALARYGARGGVFRTQRPAVARLVRVLAAGAPSIRKIEGKRLYKTPTYEIALESPTVSSRSAASHRERRLEVRGAFLACGSLATPAHGYHLEFVLPSGCAPDRLVRALTQLGIAPKRTLRKQRQVLYYKDLDQIVAVLTQIGAYGAVLQLEDVRAMKETKNRIRRLVNTEAANLDRVTSAAAAQREAIAFVADAYGLRNLTPAVREIAHLRMQHPDESLAELGRRCRPPVPKATVNGRLAIVMRLARRLREGAVRV
ncbi:MAG: DNA-binding protein WhiA [Candidatus Eremiobacteraeota bacterium]|nr:DNA-binding protein WhiA [Candidatus Eremiobacteraeota bacterium]